MADPFTLELTNNIVDSFTIEMTSGSSLVEISFGDPGSIPLELFSIIAAPGGGGGGTGVPNGGTTGQMLVKLSNANGDADWRDVRYTPGSGLLHSYAAGDGRYAGVVPAGVRWYNPGPTDADERNWGFDAVWEGGKSILRLAAMTAALAATNPVYAVENVNGLATKHSWYIGSTESMNLASLFGSNTLTIEGSVYGAYKTEFQAGIANFYDPGGSGLFFGAYQGGFFQLLDLTAPSGEGVFTFENGQESSHAYIQIASLDPTGGYARRKFYRITQSASYPATHEWYAGSGSAAAMVLDSKGLDVAGRGAFGNYATTDDMLGASTPGWGAYEYPANIRAINLWTGAAKLTSGVFISQSTSYTSGSPYLAAALDVTLQNESSSTVSGNLYGVSGYVYNYSAAASAVAGLAFGAYNYAAMTSGYLTGTYVDVYQSNASASFAGIRGLVLSSTLNASATYSAVDDLLITRSGYQGGNAIRVYAAGGNVFLVTPTGNMTAKGQASIGASASIGGSYTGAWGTETPRATIFAYDTVSTNIAGTPWSGLTGVISGGSTGTSGINSIAGLRGEGVMTSNGNGGFHVAAGASLYGSNYATGAGNRTIYGVEGGAINNANANLAGLYGMNFYSYDTVAGAHTITYSTALYAGVWLYGGASATYTNVRGIVGELDISTGNPTFGTVDNLLLASNYAGGNAIRIYTNNAGSGYQDYFTVSPLGNVVAKGRAAFGNAAQIDTLTIAGSTYSVQNTLQINETFTGVYTSADWGPHALGVYGTFNLSGSVYSYVAGIDLEPIVPATATGVGGLYGLFGSAQNNSSAVTFTNGLSFNANNGAVVTGMYLAGGSFGAYTSGGAAGSTYSYKYGALISVVEYSAGTTTNSYGLQVYLSKNAGSTWANSDGIIIASNYTGGNSLRVVTSGTNYFTVSPVGNVLAKGEVSFGDQAAFGTTLYGPGDFISTLNMYAKASFLNSMAIDAVPLVNGATNAMFILRATSLNTSGFNFLYGIYSTAAVVNTTAGGYTNIYGAGINATNFSTDAGSINMIAGVIGGASNGKAKNVNALYGLYYYIEDFGTGAHTVGESVGMYVGSWLYSGAGATYTTVVGIKSDMAFSAASSYGTVDNLLLQADLAYTGNAIRVRTVNVDYFSVSSLGNVLAKGTRHAFGNNASVADTLTFGIQSGQNAPSTVRVMNAWTSSVSGLDNGPNGLSIYDTFEMSGSGYYYPTLLNVTGDVKAGSAGIPYATAVNGALQNHYVGTEGLTGLFFGSYNRAAVTGLYMSGSGTFAYNDNASANILEMVGYRSQLLNYANATVINAIGIVSSLSLVSGGTYTNVDNLLLEIPAGAYYQGGNSIRIKTAGADYFTLTPLGNMLSKGRTALGNRASLTTITPPEYPVLQYRHDALSITHQFTGDLGANDYGVAGLRVNPEFAHSSTSVLRMDGIFVRPVLTAIGATGRNFFNIGNFQGAIKTASANSDIYAFGVNGGLYNENAQSLAMLGGLTFYTEDDSTSAHTITTVGSATVYTWLYGGASVNYPTVWGIKSELDINYGGNFGTVDNLLLTSNYTSGNAIRVRTNGTDYFKVSPLGVMTVSGTMSVTGKVAFGNHAADAFVSPTPIGPYAAYNTTYSAAVNIFDVRTGDYSGFYPGPTGLAIIQDFTSTGSYASATGISAYLTYKAGSTGGSDLYAADVFMMNAAAVGNLFANGIVVGIDNAAVTTGSSGSFNGVYGFLNSSAAGATYSQVNGLRFRVWDRFGSTATNWRGIYVANWLHASGVYTNVDDLLLERTGSSQGYAIRSTYAGTSYFNVSPLGNLLSKGKAAFGPNASLGATIPLFEDFGGTTTAHTTGTLVYNETSGDFVSSYNAANFRAWDYVTSTGTSGYSVYYNIDARASIKSVAAGTAFIGASIYFGIENRQTGAINTLRGGGGLASNWANGSVGVLEGWNSFVMDVSSAGTIGTMRGLNVGLGVYSGNSANITTVQGILSDLYLNNAITYSAVDNLLLTSNHTGGSAIRVRTNSTDYFTVSPLGNLLSKGRAAFGDQAVLTNTTPLSGWPSVTAKGLLVSNSWTAGEVGTDGVVSFGVYDEYVPSAGGANFIGAAINPKVTSGASATSGTAYGVQGGVTNSAGGAWDTYGLRFGTYVNGALTSGDIIGIWADAYFTSSGSRTASYMTGAYYRMYVSSTHTVGTLTGLWTNLQINNGGTYTTVDNLFLQSDYTGGNAIRVQTVGTDYFTVTPVGNVLGKGRAAFGNIATTSPTVPLNTPSYTYGAIDNYVAVRGWNEATGASYNSPGAVQGLLGIDFSSVGTNNFTVARAGEFAVDVRATNTVPAYVHGIDAFLYNYATNTPLMWGLVLEAYNFAVTSGLSAGGAAIGAYNYASAGAVFSNLRGLLVGTYSQNAATVTNTIGIWSTLTLPAGGTYTNVDNLLLDSDYTGGNAIRVKTNGTDYFKVSPLGNVIAKGRASFGNQASLTSPYYGPAPSGALSSMDAYPQFSVINSVSAAISGYTYGASNAMFISRVTDTSTSGYSYFYGLESFTGLAATTAGGNTILYGATINANNHSTGLGSVYRVSGIVGGASNAAAVNMNSMYGLFYYVEDYSSGTHTIGTMVGALVGTWPYAGAGATYTNVIGIWSEMELSGASTYVNVDNLLLETDTLYTGNSIRIRTVGADYFTVSPLGNLVSKGKGAFGSRASVSDSWTSYSYNGIGGSSVTVPTQFRIHHSWSGDYRAAAGYSFGPADLSIEAVYTMTGSGAQYGPYMILAQGQIHSGTTAAINPTAILGGLYNYSTATSGMAGLYFEGVNYAASAAMSYIYGGSVYAGQSAASATVTNLTGWFVNAFQTAAGTVTNMINIHSQLYFSGGGTQTNVDNLLLDANAAYTGYAIRSKIGSTEYFTLSSVGVLATKKRIYIGGNFPDAATSTLSYGIYGGISYVVPASLLVSNQFVEADIAVGTYNEVAGVYVTPEILSSTTPYGVIYGIVSEPAIKSGTNQASGVGIYGAVKNESISSIWANGLQFAAINTAATTGLQLWGGQFFVSQSNASAVISSLRGLHIRMRAHASATYTLADGVLFEYDSGFYAGGNAIRVRSSNTNYFTVSPVGVVKGATYLYNDGRNVDSREEAEQAITTTGSTLTIDYSLGRFVTLTLAHNITTFNVINWPAAGKKGMLEVIVVNTGSFGIAGYPTGSKAQGGTAPTIGSGAGVVSSFIMRTTDNGTAILVDAVADDYQAI